MTTIISCDDPTDAIRSLSQIYQVGIEKISIIANGNWPNFIIKSKNCRENLFNSPYIPSLMASHLQATSPNWNFGEVAYYHRTCYDGTAEWFQEGLLASIPAAHAFLNKVEKFIPITSADRSNAIANIRERNGFEGLGSGGPYAFDIFEDASGADQTGCDYSTPEFFVGNVWLGSNEFACAKNHIDLLRATLKPVIVKFSAIPSDPDIYICNLWQYIFRSFKGMPKSIGSDYAYTFIGGGQSIPASKILEIIDL